MCVNGFKTESHFEPSIRSILVRSGCSGFYRVSSDVKHNSYDGKLRYRRFDLMNGGHSLVLTNFRERQSIWGLALRDCIAHARS